MSALTAITVLPVTLFALPSFAEPTVQTVPVTSGTKVEIQDLQFQVQSCQRRNQDLNCLVTVTNLGKRDRPLMLFGDYSSRVQSQLTDQAGNMFVAQALQIGQDRADSYLIPTLKLTAPLQVTLIFKEIPKSVTSVTALTVGFSDRSKPIAFSAATLRNVAVVDLLANIRAIPARSVPARVAPARVAPAQPAPTAAQSVQ